VASTRAGADPFEIVAIEGGIKAALVDGMARLVLQLLGQQPWPGPTRGGDGEATISFLLSAALSSTWEARRCKRVRVQSPERRDFPLALAGLEISMHGP